MKNAVLEQTQGQLEYSVGDTVFVTFYDKGLRDDGLGKILKLSVEDDLYLIELFNNKGFVAAPVEEIRLAGEA